MRALAHGCVGIAVSNADSQVAPFGARAKFLGTNPLAVAVPAALEAPIVLDMATSVVAHGKVKAAAERNEPIPPGWAVDSAGASTTDAIEALAGALLPFGGAKGSGISLLIDLLAGSLPGGRSGPEIVPLYQRLAEPQGVGHLFVALRVDAFEPLSEFTQRVDETIRRIRSLPRAAGVERIYLPGEQEHLNAIEYGARGIPLLVDAIGEMERAGRLVSVAVPAPRRLRLPGIETDEDGRWI
jgi:ureidoglycolate dehydrogenase (NAD+)